MIKNRKASSFKQIIISFKEEQKNMNLESGMEIRNDALLEAI